MLGISCGGSHLTCLIYEHQQKVSAATRPEAQIMVNSKLSIIIHPKVFVTTTEIYWYDPPKSIGNITQKYR